MVGIDEAGRGPLAGPVAVGVVCVPKGFNWRLLPGVGDSKQISPKNRSAIFRGARALKRQGKLDFAVSLVAASIIDRDGITRSVAIGIERGMARLKLRAAEVEVQLDGLLTAPVRFKRQRTIVGGDAKMKIIGLASILAKVTRDAYMVRIARYHPNYGLDLHKGYGTKMHRDVIKRYGPSKIHRRTFLRKIA